MLPPPQEKTSFLQKNMTRFAGRILSATQDSQTQALSTNEHEVYEVGEANPIFKNFSWLSDLFSRFWMFSETPNPVQYLFRKIKEKTWILEPASPFRTNNFRLRTSAAIFHYACICSLLYQLFTKKLFWFLTNSIESIYIPMIKNTFSPTF